MACLRSQARTPVTEPEDTYVKRPHRKGCDGALYRDGTLHIDRLGRLDNGGWVAHRYLCNRYDCGALVLVTETAVRRMAVAVEVRR